MTRKLAVGLGVVFCSFVAILLLILYYPKDAVEEEFDAFTPAGAMNADEIAEPTKSTVIEVARSLEDFGAAFLALVAVACIVTGLACLACACCCVME